MDEPYSARLDDDVAERVEAFRERRGLSKSEAIKVLVGEGLAVVELEGGAESSLERVAEQLGSIDDLRGDLDEVEDELDRLSRDVSAVYRAVQELQDDDEEIERR